MNTDDEIRDKILRFLYGRHKTSKGIAKIPIGIRDLQSELKSSFGLKQHEVASNLDYLIQVGWVREVVRERSYKTPGGMEVSQEQIKFKISDIGINHIESATMFKKPNDRSINITNIQGVTVVGDGNVVNTQLTELARALDLLDEAIAQTDQLADAQKLDAAADLATIRSQISTQQPNKTIVRSAWEALEGIATVASVADAADKVGTLIGGFLE